MPTTQKQLDAGLKIADYTPEAVAANNQAISSGTYDYSTPTPSGSITSDTLAGNTKALTLPPPTVQTLGTGVQDYISSQNQTIKTEAQKQLDLDKAALDSQKGDITSLIEGIGNSGRIKNDLYQKEGVDAAKKQVDEFTSQLEAEQHSNMRRIEALKKNPQGLFAGGMEQEVNRVNSESLTKQADLAILQNNALRRYSTAAEIADRAVEAKLEPMKAKLEALKFFYAENKADFDKKDDRAYAELIAKQERDYATQKENVTKAFSSGLRNKFINEGGKIYRASDGKEYDTPEAFFADAGVSSFEDAYATGLVGDLTFEQVADMNDVLKLRSEYPDAGISITDSYQDAVDKLAFSNKYAKEVYNSDGVGSNKPVSIDGVDYFQDPATGEWFLASDVVGATSNGETTLSDKEVKELDITTEAKALKTLADLKASVQQYDSLIGQEGFALTGGGRAKLDALYADVKIKWKEAAALGALTGPDLELIQQAVPSATGFGRLNPFGANQKGVRDTLAQTIAGLDRSARNKYDQLILRNDKYGNNPYVRSLGTPFGLAPKESTTPVNLNMGNTPGLTFGATPSGNQVKGATQKLAPLPYLSTSTFQPIPTKSGGVSVSPVLKKLYPEGSYPTGKANQLRNQCGYFVKDLVTKLGGTYPAVGNTLKEKIAAVAKYGASFANAKIGSVIISKDNPTYGHVAYIIGKNAQGWLVAESNYKQSERVSYGRVIPFNSPKVVGIINPTKKA